MVTVRSARLSAPETRQFHPNTGIPTVHVQTRGAGSVVLRSCPAPPRRESGAKEASHRRSGVTRRDVKLGIILQPLFTILNISIDTPIH